MQPWLKNILLGLFALIVSSILLEIVLGVFFMIKDRGLEPMPVKDYPYLYYIFEKGQTTDDLGLKTTHPQQKPEGKYRILLTGGSVARGMGTEETISVFLEKELNERLHTDKIEVINAGMSAYVVEQEFIFDQLILQKYEPDMIISLDGYNDLMTWKLNRFDKSVYALPPHNWQQMQTIRQERFHRSFLSRFTCMFKNITRAVQSAHRHKMERDFNWNGITLLQRAEVSSAYWSAIEDTRKFCEAKQIDYYNFLQPVRFYRPGADTNKLSPEEKGLSSIYMLMDFEAIDKPYVFSLTKLLKGRDDLYIDDCHVKPEGNKIIAKMMADILQPPLADYLLPATPVEQTEEEIIEFPKAKGKML